MTGLAKIGSVARSSGFSRYGYGRQDVFFDDDRAT